MATSFNLSNLNSGKWFTYEGGGKIQLRSFTIIDFENINKKAGKALQNKLTWDFCIMDWKNFYDLNRDPIPCTAEYKLFLMDNNLKFSKFVIDSIESIIAK